MTLAELAGAPFFELTYPGGRREIVPTATYGALPLEALAFTIARPLCRVEAIRLIAAARKRAA